MKNLNVSSSGFISLSFVFILMTFISLYLTATFAIALSQQRDYIRTTCVNEATDIQANLLKEVRALFAMNSTSTTLRLSIKATEAAIAAALASLQFEAIPHLQQELEAFLQAQKTLDALQQAMIAKIKLELATRHIELVAKIHRGQLEIGSPWRFMITMSSYFTPRFMPVLAIRPDSEGGIGPNYEWQDDAEKKQTLAYSWNMFFETKASYQKFFNWFNVLSIQCAVGPNLKKEQWQLTINADK